MDSWTETGLVPFSIEINSDRSVMKVRNTEVRKERGTVNKTAL